MPQLTTLSESAFQRQVLAFARLHGWRFCHFRPGLNRRGKWQTAVQGDPGFPDLILIRGSRLIVAELKVGRNKCSPEQEAWLEAFRGAGVEWYVWKPADWDSIVDRLAR